MVDSNTRSTISNSLDQYEATVEKAIEICNRTYDSLNTNKSQLTGDDASFIERFNKTNKSFMDTLNSHGTLTPSSA